MKRPLDFTDLYPERSVDELITKFRYEGFVSATSLSAINIHKLCQADHQAKKFFIDKVMKNEDLQFDLFQERVRCMSIGEEIKTALLQCDRRKFLPGKSKHLWFLDYSLPSLNQSWASAPSIVGLMIENLHGRESAQTIVEIGSGCGYHLSVLARVSAQDHVSLVGFEIDAELAKYSAGIVSQKPKGKIDIVACDAFGHSLIRLADVVFATCAFSNDQFISMKKLLRPGAYLQLPRPPIESDSPIYENANIPNASYTGKFSTLTTIDDHEDRPFLTGVTFIPSFGSNFINDSTQPSAAVKWLYSIV